MIKETLKQTLLNILNVKISLRLLSPEQLSQTYAIKGTEERNSQQLLI